MARARRLRPARPRPPLPPPLVVGAGVLLLALAVALLWWWGRGGDDGAPALPVAEQEPAALWRIANMYPGDVPLLGSGAARLAERVAALSAGRWKLVPEEPGVLASSLEVFDEVSAGRIVAVWSSPAYWQRQIPAAVLFSGLPFGPEPVAFMAWLEQGGGLELWRKLYAAHDLYPIPCGLLPPKAFGWFRKPLVDQESLKELRLRFLGLGGDVLARMGARLRRYSGADLPIALGGDYLDGTEFFYPSLDAERGFARQARHYYLPGWQQRPLVLELTVNLGRWKGLSPAAQGLLETACRDNALHLLAAGEAAQPDGLRELARQRVMVRRLTAQMLAALREATEAVLAEHAGRDRDFARVLRSWRAFEARYRTWTVRAGLPPETASP